MICSENHNNSGFDSSKYSKSQNQTQLPFGDIFQLSDYDSFVFNNQSTQETISLQDSSSIDQFNEYQSFTTFYENQTFNQISNKIKSLSQIDFEGEEKIPNYALDNQNRDETQYLQDQLENIQYAQIEELNQTQFMQQEQEQTGIRSIQINQMDNYCEKCQKMKLEFISVFQNLYKQKLANSNQKSGKKIDKTTYEFNQQKFDSLKCTHYPNQYENVYETLNKNLQLLSDIFSNVFEKFRNLHQSSENYSSKVVHLIRELLSDCYNNNNNNTSSNNKYACFCSKSYKDLGSIHNHIREKHNNVAVWIYKKEISYKVGRPKEEDIPNQQEVQKQKKRNYTFNSNCLKNNDIQGFLYSILH